MEPLRFAVFGAGYWTRPQLAAWREVEGAECVALYNRTRPKAELLARELGIPAVYDDPGELLRQEKVDFIDVITAPAAHEEHVLLAASQRVPVICQKPLAPSLESAQRMVDACARAGVPLLVHENWRWQTPIRQLKRILDEGAIGAPFRARLELISGVDVMERQPFLREEKRFILTDMGSHQLDVARFLFGEAGSVYAQTDRIHAGIAGEDVATVVLRMRDRTTVVVTLGYAGNFLEHDRYGEVSIFIEGEKGSLELAPDSWIRVTTAAGTLARRHPPPRYRWADPTVELAQASIVPCHANLLQALNGTGRAETTGEDNLETLRLVFAAYDSAETGRAVSL